MILQGDAHSLFPSAHLLRWVHAPSTEEGGDARKTPQGARQMPAHPEPGLFGFNEAVGGSRLTVR